MCLLLLQFPAPHNSGRKPWTVLLSSLWNDKEEHCSSDWRCSGSRTRTGGNTGIKRNTSRFQCPGNNFLGPFQRGHKGCWKPFLIPGNRSSFNTLKGITPAVLVTGVQSHKPTATMRRSTTQMQLRRSTLDPYVGVVDVQPQDVSDKEHLLLELLRELQQFTPNEEAKLKSLKQWVELVTRKLGTHALNNKPEYFTATSSRHPDPDAHQDEELHLEEIWKVRSCCCSA